MVFLGQKIGFKDALSLVLIAVLLLVIPLSVTMIKKQQIFKGRAATKSKLGIQTSYQKPSVMEFIEASKPLVVKLLGGYETASEIKQKSPGTFIVGRIWEQNQPMDGDPNSRAQEWFDRNRGTLERPNIDCWEGYNEPDANRPDQISAMQWYSSFETKRMQLLESIGKKACIGTFSTGNPDLSLWPHFRGALDYAASGGHFLSLHEYGPGRMDTDASWHSLRHRQVYSQNNLSLPLIITETGIDTNGNPDSGGWRAHTSSTNDYLEQLKWYDREIQNDAYVKGATIFSYGLFGWASFELYPELIGNDGKSGPLTSYIRGSSVPPSGGGDGCKADACTSCILNNRPDILPFYQKNGWDTGCYKYVEIVNNWCGIDQPSCNNLKTGKCAVSCGVSVTPTPSSTVLPTITPFPTKTPTPTQQPPTPTIKKTITSTPTPPLSTTLAPLPPEQVQFDINEDSKINSFDTGLFLEDWRSSQNNGTYDFNSDEVINSIDYSLLINNLSQ